MVDVHLGALALWNLIIRPPRCHYCVDELGARLFRIGNFVVQRDDFDIVNGRGQTLKCSYYKPHAPAGSISSCPVVVYLHGNSSSRLEAIGAVELLLPLHVAVFCFDFAGCGLSQGEFVSLGYWEREDLAQVIEFLRTDLGVEKLALWGRSMGAVTALLHIDRDPTIAAVIADSPFSNLPQLCEELASSRYNSIKIPSWLISVIMPLVSSVIQVKAGFDINDLSPIDHVGKAFTPCLFVAGDRDDFIVPEHVQALHEAYGGDKEFLLVSGDHNSIRPDDMRRKSVLFLARALRLDDILEKHNSGMFDILRAGELLMPAMPGAEMCQQIRQACPGWRDLKLLQHLALTAPMTLEGTIKLGSSDCHAGFCLGMKQKGFADGYALVLFVIYAVSSVHVLKLGHGGMEPQCSQAVSMGSRTPFAAGVSLHAGCSMMTLLMGDQSIEHYVDDRGLSSDVDVWLVSKQGQSHFAGFVFRKTASRELPAMSCSSRGDRLAAPPALCAVGGFSSPGQRLPSGDLVCPSPSSWTAELGDSNGEAVTLQPRATVAPCRRASCSGPLMPSSPSQMSPQRTHSEGLPAQQQVRAGLPTRQGDPVPRLQRGNTSPAETQPLRLPVSCQGLPVNRSDEELLS
mmetsp:Transcript_38169/g.99957  ORF Transcript_38169/g.99957 Transcript_38169/m.99957 type:complete len:628 (+) Transcript_38169:89-1972(+)